jgi:glycosyltransferase involved in cell wall biosynthesis
MKTSDKCPKVSIILPVFNGRSTLLAAVQSIVHQSFLDWELILLDDGSTDGCIQSIEHLKDSRIRVYSDGFRKGLSARLNQGIELASGLYLARMDADDLSFPNRIEKQVAFLDSRSDIDLLACKTLKFSLKGDQILIGTLPYLQTHAELTAAPWRGIYMPHPSWMGKTQWYRNYRYRFPEALRAEDQELLLRAMPESSYYCMPEILLAYHQTPFKLAKSLLARKGLFKSQLSIFLKRRQWMLILKSIIITIQRIAYDFIRVLFLERFLFKKSSAAEISEIDLITFKVLLKKYGGYP